MKVTAGDSRHVSPITNSLGHETNTKLCLRNTALIRCDGYRSDNLQELYVLFSAVFCVKGLYYIFVMPMKCFNRPDSFC
jgi:hypothetical protein